MDMEQIECFLAVSRYSSFSKASYEISISQSSISKKILSLEKELGVSLFERLPHTVKLTEAGLLLSEYGERIFQAYSDFTSKLMNDKKLLKSKLIIGSIYFSSSASIMPVIAEYSKLYPDIELETVESTTTPLVEALLNSTIDAAFVSSMYPCDCDNPAPNFSQDHRLISYSISKDPYYLVVSKKHPLVNSTIVDYQDIKNEKFIGLDKKMDVYQKAFNKIFESENIMPAIVARSSSTRDALTLVSNNIGIAILSPKVTTDCQDIVLIPLKRPLIRDSQIIIRNEKEIPQNIRRFFNFIKSAFK